MLSLEEKALLWELLSVTKPRPYGVTDRRLARVKPIVDQSTFFWSDIEAHIDVPPFKGPTLDVLERQAREHMIGNFWGMIVQMMYKSGILKP